MTGRGKVSKANIIKLPRHQKPNEPCTAARSKQLKVHSKYFSRVQSSVIFPGIRLCGKWLQDIGFNCGQEVHVKQEFNKITITVENWKGRMLACGNHAVGYVCFAGIPYLPTVIPNGNEETYQFGIGKAGRRGFQNGNTRYYDVRKHIPNGRAEFSNWFNARRDLWTIGSGGTWNCTSGLRSLIALGM